MLPNTTWCVNYLYEIYHTISQYRDQIFIHFLIIQTTHYTTGQGYINTDQSGVDYKLLITDAQLNYNDQQGSLALNSEAETMYKVQTDRLFFKNSK